jgi:hypothetical protein
MKRNEMEIKIGQKFIGRKQVVIEVISKEVFQKEADLGCLAEPDRIQFRVTHEIDGRGIAFVDQWSKEELLEKFMPWDMT